MILLNGCGIKNSNESNKDKSLCTHEPQAFRCVEYISNYDGDTISVQIPGVHSLIGEKISVRVRGIDSAEIKASSNCEKAAAKSARDFVHRALAGAAKIDLENVARDKYFRIVADVIYDGESISDNLLKKNLAVAYDGGRKPRTDWCRIAYGDSSSVN